MSDISAALQSAIASTLRADEGVIAAFGAARVQIFDVVPPNQPEPYLELGLGDVLPVLVEGFDLSEIDVPVHVWSRPSPPSVQEAQRIAGAVQAALPNVQVAAGGRVYAARPVRSTYLRDPSDPRAIHAIITTRFTTAPA